MKTMTCCAFCEKWFPASSRRGQTCSAQCARDQADYLAREAARVAAHPPQPEIIEPEHDPTALWCTIWDGVYAVCADWAQAAAPVYVWLHDERAWAPTGYQVADVRHVAHDALRRELEELALAGGDAEQEEAAAEIEAALARASWGEA